MAKKVANGINKKQPRRRSTESSPIEKKPNFQIGGEAGNSFQFSHLARELISNPTVKYLAGGVATAILSRLATNMADKYPELSRFLRENIDGFEERLNQYRPSYSQDRESRI